MATTPCMHSRRDANSPTGVPNSYIPLSDGTLGRRRIGTPALAAIGTLKLPLIFLFLVLTLLFAAAACATADDPSRGERASSGAPLALLPDDTTRLEVLKVGDILGGAVPESFEERFEAQWDPYSLGDDIVTIDDVGEMVKAFAKGGEEILMMGGSQIDFAGIRDWLDSEEANIERTSYQGQDLWGDDRRGMIILDGYLIQGDTEALKEVLKVKARGTGSLNQASDNSLKQAYEDARAGWYVLASENCDEFSGSLRSCEAYSITGGQGEEDYLVDVTYRFQFRSEERAESQALDIEDLIDDLIDDLNWDIDLDEVKADGTSVEARASGDEEDFSVAWLVSYSGIRTPSPLPTAVPEEEPTPSPEAQSTRTTTTGRATEAPTPTQAPAATTAPRSPSALSKRELAWWVLQCGENRRDRRILEILENHNWSFPRASESVMEDNSTAQLRESYQRLCP